MCSVFVCDKMCEFGKEIGVLENFFHDLKLAKHGWNGVISMRGIADQAVDEDAVESFAPILHEDHQSPANQVVG